MKSGAGVLRLAAGAIGLLLAFGLAMSSSSEPADFRYDWLTSRALWDGVDPYQPLRDLAAATDKPDGPSWIHPRTPAALLLQAPLGLLPESAIPVAGRLMVFASAVFALWVLGRMARIHSGWMMLGTPLLLTAPFLDSNLKLGQTGLLIAALVALTWHLGDKVWAGIPLAIAISIKLWPWMLIASLWASGRRRAALGTSAIFTCLMLVGLGLEKVDIVGMLRSFEAVGPSFRSLSLADVFGLPVWLPAIACLAVIVFLRDYRYSVVLALLGAPLIWPHYLAALLVVPFIRGPQPEPAEGAPTSKRVSPHSLRMMKRWGPSGSSEWLAASKVRAHADQRSVRPRHKDFVSSGP